MLTTVVLAAGESRRFKKFYGEDYPPKQFLKFQATRSAEPAQMWENVAHHLTLDTSFFVVMQNGQSKHLNLAPRRRLTEYIWLDPTRGQADTLRRALWQIRTGGEVLVLNCDNGFGPGVLNRLVHEGRYHRMCAALTFERNQENRWSFVDGHPLFHSAAERRMLTQFALAGAYYFTNASEALFAAERACGNAMEPVYIVGKRDPVGYVDVAPEKYISSMFGYIPDPKLSVDIDPDDFYDWGTPDALQNFVRKR